MKNLYPFLPPKIVVFVLGFLQGMEDLVEIYSSMQKGEWFRFMYALIFKLLSFVKAKLCQYETI